MRILLVNNPSLIIMPRHLLDSNGTVKAVPTWLLWLWHNDCRLIMLMFLRPSLTLTYMMRPTSLVATRRDIGWIRRKVRRLRVAWRTAVREVRWSERAHAETGRTRVADLAGRTSSMAKRKSTGTQWGARNTPVDCE